MKKLTAIMIIALLPAVVMGQSKTLDSFIDKYIDHEEVTYVQIKGSLFNLISSIAEYDNGEEPDEDLQAIGRIADGIESMVVLSVPYYDTNISKEEVTSLKSGLAKEKYEEFIKVKDGKELVSVRLGALGVVVGRAVLHILNLVDLPLLLTRLRHRQCLLDTGHRPNLLNMRRRRGRPNLAGLHGQHLRVAHQG